MKLKLLSILLIACCFINAIYGASPLESQSSNKKCIQGLKINIAAIEKMFSIAPEPLPPFETKQKELEYLQKRHAMLNDLYKQKQAEDSEKPKQSAIPKKKLKPKATIIQQTPIQQTPIKIDKLFPGDLAIPTHTKFERSKYLTQLFTAQRNAFLYPTKNQPQETTDEAFLKRIKEQLKEQLAVVKLARITQSKATKHAAAQKKAQIAAEKAQMIAQKKAQMIAQKLKRDQELFSKPVTQKQPTPASTEHVEPVSRRRLAFKKQERTVILKPQPNSTATSSSMDTTEDTSFSPINFDIADITSEDLFELPEEDFSMLFALTHDDPFLSPALAEAGAGAALPSVSHMETEEDSFSLSSGEESEQEEPASALPEPESKHHTHKNKHYRSFVKNIVGVRTEPYKRKPRSRKQNESDIGRLLNLDALS